MATLDSRTFLPADVHESVVARLSDFRRHVRSRMLLEGVARLLGALVAAGLLTFALDRLFRLSLPARLAVLALTIVGVMIVAWRHIIAPLRLRLDALTLASALDRVVGGHGSVTARIATVLGLPSLLRGPSPPSAAMVREAVLHCNQTLSQLDFRSRLNDHRRNMSALFVMAGLLLPMWMVFAAPATARLWAERTFLGSNRPWPQKTYLTVAGLKDGVLVVPRGEPFVLRVSARKRSIVPESVSVRFREGSGSRVTGSFTAFGHNDFRYDLAGVHDNTIVEVWGGDDDFGPFTIRPADRPRIADLKLITQHPTEPQPTTHTFSGEDSDLSFLPKTKMQLLFTASTPIAAARITSATTQPSEANLHRLDDQRFSIEWVQEADVHLQIELVSRDAQLVSAPTEVAIGLKTDHPPRLTLGYTGVRQRVTPRARIPLTVDARDDYGVASASLLVKAETPDPANPAALKPTEHDTALYGPVAPTTDLEVQQAHTLQLEPMALPPGSLVTVSAAATDACYTGPQTSRSRQVTFRVVPPEELFREILLRQQAERAKFRKQTDEARAIREQLRTLAQITSVPEIAHRSRAMQREVASVSTTLSDTVNEMRLNALGTDQAYEMIEQKVLTPLKSLNEDMLNPQKDAIESLDPADTKALGDAQDRQDKIVGQMEQILKQMAQWDSFVDVLNQLNEIIRIQGQAQQSTNELKKQQTESIFEK